MIEEIINQDLKQTITSKILYALPHWFGIESAIKGYINSSKDLPFFAYKVNDEFIGFIVLEEKTNINLDIHVLGVLETYHRQGIGKKLVNEAIKYAKKNGYKYLTVKTLDDSVDDESYKKTRNFYYAMGFERFEVYPTLWDEYNICLEMIMQIK